MAARRSGYGSRYDTTRPLSHSELADHAAADHEFTEHTRAILVTGDGNLTMRMIGDTHDLTLAVTAGMFLPLQVSVVRRASTAAVIGFW